jgi:hypothetical protein
MGGASGVKDLVFRAYRAGARTVSVHVTSSTAISTLLEALCKHVTDFRVTSNILYSVPMHLPICNPDSRAIKGAPNL